MPNTAFGRIVRSPKLTLWAVIVLMVAVVLALLVSVLTINERSAADDRNAAADAIQAEQVRDLQRQLSCRATDNLTFDLAQGQGFLGVLKGLRLSLDPDGDNVATRPEFQATLQDIDVSIASIVDGISRRTEQLQNLVEQRDPSACP